MLELNQYIKDNCPFLLKLTQMTEVQEKEVCEKYGVLPCKMQLDKMNNWRNITKNRSVYHTLNKWFEMDIQAGKQAKQRAKAKHRKRRIFEKTPNRQQNSAPRQNIYRGNKRIPNKRKQRVFPNF